MKIDPSILAHKLAQDTLRWPILNAAHANSYLAHDPKVKWSYVTASSCPHCHSQIEPLTVRSNFNYTQIFRTPVLRDEETGDALSRHLDEIEKELRVGFRNFDPETSSSTLGGVFEFLDRWPTKDDTLKLAILRPTELIYRTSSSQEWISEVSLVVIPRPS